MPHSIFFQVLVNYIIFLKLVLFSESNPLHQFISFIFIRYQILPCDEIHEHFITTKSLAQDADEECYGHKNSRVTKDVFWLVFSFLIQFVLRLFPTVLICSLNTWMYFKLKRVQRHRDKIFGVPAKESTSGSNHILHKSLSDPTWSGTIKNRLTKIISKKDEKPLRSVSEIVMKVN